jgi:hypothetical protein
MQMAWWSVIGLVLGLVTGWVASFALVKDSGNLWLWESRKVQDLEKELAEMKAKVREQHLTLGWDLQ